MSIVFITGGTGYIGRYLIPQLLKRGHQVRALVRPGSESKLPTGCITVIGNALEKGSYTNQIAPSDTFIHLIGVSHPGPAKNELFRTVDLASIEIAVPAAKEAGIKHFLYLSVAQPLPFIKVYAQVRREGEELIRSSGMGATILRPFYILGPGHWWPYLAMPLFFLIKKFYARGKHQEKLGFVTIRQMVNALVIAIENPSQKIRTLEVPQILHLSS